MKQANIKHLNNIWGWEKIKQIGLLEIWKTPTKYLVCFHYQRHFHFYNSLEEACESVKQIVQSYT